MAIMVTRSSLPPYEEYCEEIRKFWDSHWLTNMGEEHQLLQQRLKEYLGCPEVVLFTNGHLALENVIAAFDFPKGSEVITTPFTFVSTTHAIVRNGLKPVFCDVDPVDYTLDDTKLEDLITEKTVAIVPVHVYGNLCHVDAIDRIAKKYGLKVIYDAAHAFAETFGGVSPALFGDASMFSFHATKVFNTIEGGAVTTKDAALAEKLEDMKNFGIRNAESCVFAGGNAKMNEFQAAMGICNLRHLPEEIKKRKAVFERYSERLAGVNNIVLPHIEEGVQSNYTYYPVIFKESPEDTPSAPVSSGGKKRRDRIFDRLKDNDIIARKYFYPLTSAYECYREQMEDPYRVTPVAAWTADRVLTLPLYADLEPENADRIADIILA